MTTETRFITLIICYICFQFHTVIGCDMIGWLLVTPIINFSSLKSKAVSYSSCTFRVSNPKQIFTGYKLTILNLLPFTLRHGALVLPRPPRGNHWQGHPWLVLAPFVHHPVVALLPDHTMRRSGRGGGGGSDDHVCVVWLVGGVVGVATLWTEEGQIETWL